MGQSRRRLLRRAAVAAAGAAALPLAGGEGTSMGVRGRQTGRGTLKVTHEKPRGRWRQRRLGRRPVDQARGRGHGRRRALFVDSRPATAGRLADVRNAGVHLFVVGPDGKVWVKALGVANAEGASSLGPLRRRMEVFDYARRSLGFVPIYGR